MNTREKMKQEFNRTILKIILIAFLGIISLLTVWSYSINKYLSVSTTKEFLEANGFTNIEIETGRYKCSQDYYFKTSFKANTPKYKTTVEGCVCEGIISNEKFIYMKDSVLLENENSILPTDINN